jgi:S1-C subfamily serine protease
MNNKRGSLIFIAMVVALALVAGVLAVSAQDDSPQPYLGITFRPADEGAQVVRVLPDSPAAAAGLERGDLITAVNGEAVDATTLAETVSTFSVGDEITLDVLRDDEPLELAVTLAEQPVRATIRIQPQTMMRQQAFLGVTLEAADGGVSIVSVSDGSPAAEAGLQAGDLITAVNGETVNTPAQLTAAIRSQEPGAAVTLSITRDGEAQEVEVTLGSMLGRMSAMLGDIIVYDGLNWRIISLSADSALAAAGLQAGDAVTAVDGESYAPAALADYLSGLDEGATVTLTVERDGETLEVTVNAADLDRLSGFGLERRFRFEDGFRGPRGERIPRFEFRGPRGQFSIVPGGVRLGVQYQDLNEEIAAEHDLEVAEGALITAVLPDSPAAEAGLQVDDVVVAVEGDAVDARRTLRERLLAYDPGETITLEILRAGEPLSIDVTLAEVNLREMLEGLDLPFDFDGEFPRFFFGPHGGIQIEPVQPSASSANL